MFYIILNTNYPQFYSIAGITYKKTFYFQVHKKCRMRLSGDWNNNIRNIEVRQPKSSKLKNNKNLWII